jgi:hypothetical protein
MLSLTTMTDGHIRQAAGGGVAPALRVALGLTSWLAVVVAGRAGLVTSLPLWAVIAIATGVTGLTVGELTIRVRRARQP